MEYEVVHAKRFAATAAHIPRWYDATAGKALDIGTKGGYFDAALVAAGWEVEHGDWDPALPRDRLNFDCQKTWPFPDGAFDLVLMCEVIEHLPSDPMGAIAEANRVLRHGGRLLLTTPNICSARGLSAMMQNFAPYLYAKFNRHGTDRHVVEYSPLWIMTMLSAGGFHVKLWTENVWGDPPGLPPGARPEDRGDCMMAMATKATDVVDRYPAMIYDG